MNLFFDPVLRAPLWGCMLMCIASSLMGVLVFLQRRSLFSETLSHATYPGACMGVVLFALLFPQFEEWVFVAVLGGSLLSSLAALKMLHRLEVRWKVKPDAALCFVLSFFFGIGIVIVSMMQSLLPVWCSQVQMLLFGQVATMTDIHIWIYGALALFVIAFIALSFRPLQAVLFDPNFARNAKLPAKNLERAVFWLLLFSLIIGIRSVGVVLMSGMVIAPAVAARQLTHRLQPMLVIAGSIGAASGLIGNFLALYTQVPTGPMIVLTGAAFAMAALFFSLSLRILRIGRFRLRCLEENILKAMWKKKQRLQSSSGLIFFAMWRLKKAGWIDAQGLTKDGENKAASIIRLHRLWELYLSEELGVEAEKVHRTAEEMEHILTAEMEERLTRLLDNPKSDPHQQPIPERSSL